MGNIVQSGRQERVKPDQTLATVRAAGAFKAKLKQSNRKTTSEQIEEIRQRIVRRKKAGARKLASIDELQEQTPDDVDASKDALKFVHRYSILRKVRLILAATRSGFENQCLDMTSLMSDLYLLIDF